MQKVRKHFENYRTIKEGIERLEENLDIINNRQVKITKESSYCFRLKDNLLIRVEEYRESDNHNFESITKYEPELF